ncbi:MAG: malto-oligosyltrehalose trehalohydrolase, partial [Actinobacteria bacterium]|nr:malto-oligosyltrehalose trehalohydrolase [Actinomycetota bacterium]
VEPGTAGRPATCPAGGGGDVLYELHVGTFSEPGTFAGVVPHLDALVDLGVTVVELMPVNQFPGERGWGYDGIFWSAAQHSYGGPAELVRLVDAAHERGLAIVVDVVFNHLGPTGDTLLSAFGPFFTDRHRTPWGPAINLDGPGSDAVRDTILQAAAWWVRDVGADGLRVDACHALVDQRPRHVLAELTDHVHAVRPGVRLVAESGLNDPGVVRAEHAGGWGFDADWADDFHHALRTLLTDDRRGWLVDFGEVAHLAKAFDRPLVHDGTWSGYRDRTFGAPASDVDPARFVVFSQNHDQVGNRPRGDRLPRAARPLAALCTLFSPSTPMLFMGEEHGEDAPFQFFTDHLDPFIADATRDGRRAEFAGLADGGEVPDPQARSTFEASRLIRRVDPDLADLYARLVALRPRIGSPTTATEFDEVGRWLRVERGDWRLVANFGTEPASVPCPPGDVAVATDDAPRWTLTPGGDPALLLAPRSGAVVHGGDGS